MTLVYADESKSTLEEYEKLRKKVQNIEIEILGNDESYYINERLVIVLLNPVAITWTSDLVPASSKDFFDIQANYRV